MFLILVHTRRDRYSPTLSTLHSRVRFGGGSAHTPHLVDEQCDRIPPYCHNPF
ncbi:MAG: hypothetical protein PUP92_01675 [Rhizonema sp. PD38]|nr:hypothetical protein [Rhizonema sp. PD38]